MRTVFLLMQRATSFADSLKSLPTGTCIQNSRQFDLNPLEVSLNYLLLIILDD